MNKPFKGHITNWRRVWFPTEGVYTIVGQPHGHPEFTGWIRTSIVKREIQQPDWIRIETLNSVYLLIGPEVKDVPREGIQKP